MNRRRRRCGYDQAAVRLPRECTYSALQAAHIAWIDHAQLHRGRSRGLDSSKLADPGGEGRVANDRYPRRLGATSLSTASHFPPMLYSNAVNPLMLPPGRARLVT